MNKPDKSYILPTRVLANLLGGLAFGMMLSPSFASAEFQDALRSGIEAHGAGDKASAEKQYRRALAAADRTTGFRDKLKVLLNLADLQPEDQPAKYMSLYEQALSLIEKQYGDNAPESVLVLDKLASGALMAGEAAKAEAYASSAVAIRERCLSRNNRETYEPLQKLHETKWRLQKWQEAEALAIRILAIRKQHAGWARNPSSPFFLDTLAVDLIKTGKWEQARKYSDEAIKMADSIAAITDDYTLWHNRGTLAVTRAKILRHDGADRTKQLALLKAMCQEVSGGKLDDRKAVYEKIVSRSEFLEIPDVQADAKQALKL